MVQNI